MPAARYRTCEDSSSTFSRGWACRPPPACDPSSRRSSSAPSPPPTRHRLRRHRLRLPRERRGSCWRSPWRSSSRRCCARALETPTGEAALGGVGLGLGALLFAGTLDDRYATWWPGIIGGLLCAPHRPGGRALAADAHAGAARRRGRRRAVPLRRGRRAAARGPRGPHPARSASSPSASSSGCASAAAGARARSTPACASCGEPEARPRRRRRPQAGDARARGRHRPRAGDGRRHGARDLRRRLRRGVPVGHAGVRGHDRDGRAAGRPPDPVDELVLARRAAATSSTARRSAPRGASASSSSSPTRSTT